MKTELDKSGVEILPCPFCGSDDVDANFSLVEQAGKRHNEPGCMNCGAIAPNVGIWNMRSAKAVSAIACPDLLRQLVLDCINDLATYIVPDSGITEHDVVNTLLGRLDGPQARAALKTESVPPTSACIEADILHNRITDCRRLAIATMTSDKWVDLTDAEQDVILDALRFFTSSASAKPESEK